MRTLPLDVTKKRMQVDALDSHTCERERENLRHYPTPGRESEDARNQGPGKSPRHYHTPERESVDVHSPARWDQEANAGGPLCPPKPLRLQTRATLVTASHVET